MKALMRGLMVLVMLGLFGVVVGAQEATEIPDIAAVVTEAAPDVVVVPDEVVVAPIVNVSELGDYGLFGASLIFFGVIVIVLSLLVAYLSKNNVTMISVPAVKDLVMGVAAEVGKVAYNAARKTESPIDDTMALAVLGAFYTITEHGDGTLSLVRKVESPFSAT